MFKVLTTIQKIDSAYVRGISDIGTSLTTNKAGKVIDSDDLRLTIELPGQHLFILNGAQHLGYERDENGHAWLHIYEYLEEKE
jgi:hypothetical protein